MIPAGKLLLAASASVAAYGLWKFSQFAYHVFTSPLRRLPGPKGKSWVYGNMREIVKAVRHLMINLGLTNLVNSARF